MFALARESRVEGREGGRGGVEAGREATTCSCILPTTWRPTRRQEGWGKWSSAR